MEDKSHVGLMVCVACGTEPTAVLLDRRLKPTLTKHEFGTDVCEKCKEKYKDYVICIEAQKEKVPKRYSWEKQKESMQVFARRAFIKKDVWSKIFNSEAPERGMAFLESEVMDRMELFAKKAGVVPDE